ncbi:MAG: enoyl-CoA hydratase-related protein [Alphaproteobacteria bacterium]
MITTERTHGTLLINFDDGDKNILTIDAVTSLYELLIGLERDEGVKSLIIQGNDKALSVGLDNKIVLQNSDRADRMRSMMGAILRLLYLGHLRVITIASGHATAAGAMLLLTADHRIGVSGPGKIGLSEVRVGLDVPKATQQLAKDRLIVPAQYPATALGRLYDYDTAHKVGYLDEVVADRAAALDAAYDLAAELNKISSKGYRATKRGMRQAFDRLTA